MVLLTEMFHYFATLSSHKLQRLDRLGRGGGGDWDEEGVREEWGRVEEWNRKSHIGYGCTIICLSSALLPIPYSRLGPDI